MRRADFLRAKESRRDSIAHALKLSGDVKESESKMSVDVFEEHLLWLNFAHDPRDVRPQVPWVFVRELLPRTTERLAGISRDNQVDMASPVSRFESRKVGPNRRIVHAAVLNTRSQDAGRTGFPFHVQPRDSFRASEFNSEVEASVTGAQGGNTEWGR